MFRGRRPQHVKKNSNWLDIAFVAHYRSRDQFMGGRPFHLSGQGTECRKARPRQMAMPRLGNESDGVRSRSASYRFISAPRTAPKGGLVRGAAGGAAIGAAGGAIGGSAGKGAAIGAVAGGLLGTMRRNNQVRQDQQAQQQWAYQSVAQYEQNRSNWVRSVRACLTGRGYTVE
jgi:hypothetical protein